VSKQAFIATVQAGVNQQFIPFLSGFSDVPTIELTWGSPDGNTFYPYSIISTTSSGFFIAYGDIITVTGQLLNCYCRD
jgi:hypothetical protein